MISSYTILKLYCANYSTTNGYNTSIFQVNPVSVTLYSYTTATSTTTLGQRTITMSSTGITISNGTFYNTGHGTGNCCCIPLNIWVSNL